MYNVVTNITFFFLLHIRTDNGEYININYHAIFVMVKCNRNSEEHNTTYCEISS